MQYNFGLHSYLSIIFLFIFFFAKNAIKLDRCTTENTAEVSSSLSQVRALTFTARRRNENVNMARDSEIQLRIFRV